VVEWQYRLDPQEFTGSFSSNQKSELNVDVEYDSNRGVEKQDETQRPSLDSK